MKRIIKQDLSITLAVLAIAIFAFFFWMYPYHFVPQRANDAVLCTAASFSVDIFRRKRGWLVSPAISLRNSFIISGEARSS